MNIRSAVIVKFSYPNHIHRKVRLLYLRLSDGSQQYRGLPPPPSSAVKNRTNHPHGSISFGFDLQTPPCCVVLVTAVRSLAQQHFRVAPFQKVCKCSALTHRTAASTPGWPPSCVLCMRNKLSIDDDDDDDGSYKRQQQQNMRAEYRPTSSVWWRVLSFAQFIIRLLGSRGTRRKQERARLNAFSCVLIRFSVSNVKFVEFHSTSWNQIYFTQKKI